MRGMQWSDILRVAADADVDPRTIRKLLDGEDVRGRAGERGREAIARFNAQQEKKPIQGRPGGRDSQQLAGREGNR